MASFFWALFGFIISIGILVTFHEYGHFWVARRFGVKVKKFSIGFGKPIWKRTSKKGIEYVIAMVPFGGYVKMLDEREHHVAESQLHQTFNYQPIWIRTLIVLAGPIFNFIFAVFAYWIIFSIGIASISPVVGMIQKQSIVGQAGFKNGDKLLMINGESVENWQQVNLAFIAKLGEKYPVNVTYQPLGSKQIEQTKLDLSNWKINKSRPDILGSLGFVPYYPNVPAIIAEVIPNQPAALAGLKKNDKVLSIEGVSIKKWEDILPQLNRYINKKIVITVKRGNKILHLSLVPGSIKQADGLVQAQIGVRSYPIKWPDELKTRLRYPVPEALLKSVAETGRMIKLSLVVLYKMLIGQISIHSVSGPIGIAQGAGYSAQLGFNYFLSFLALISISLGIINLLPIPTLDGGHLLYYLIEVIRGKPLSDKAQLIGFKIGLILILGLMFLAISNDISRLFH